jgi:hypothetical protein
MLLQPCKAGLGQTHGPHYTGEKVKVQRHSASCPWLGDSPLLNPGLPTWPLLFSLISYEM